MSSENLNEFLFIGIGQAGGNIADIAKKTGYEAVAINTSPEDLNTLQFVRNTLFLKNNGGCGKDRNEGIELVKKEYKAILNYLDPIIKPVNFIFMVFSTGGGTGSGISPILTNLLIKKYPNKKIILLAVMPHNNESLAALDNNIQCLKEIYNLNLPTLLVDNEKFVDKNKKRFSRQELLDLINIYTISNLDLLFNSELEMSSKYGNIDNKDLNRLFESPGMITINKRLFKKQDYENGIENIILNSIDENIYADINKDGVIDRIGFIFEVSKNLMPNSNYDEIKKEIGIPIEIFEGFREINNPSDDKYRVITVLSGLSFPKNRIEEYSKLINQLEENVKSIDDIDVFKNINGGSGIRKKRKRNNISSVIENKEDNKNENIEIDLTDLFSKY